MTITAAKLESLKACSAQIATFRELFGEGPAPMTVETAVEYADTFDWDWAAQHLLDHSARRTYNETLAPIRRTYYEARAPILRAYDAARAPIRRTYNEGKARAFAEAYILQESR